MTGAEMKSIINAKRGEGQELLSIMFDNNLYANFVHDDEFDINCIKSVGGVDCVEINTLSFNSSIPGEEKIKMTAVQPVEYVQALMFVPKDRKNEISPRDLELMK